MENEFLTDFELVELYHMKDKLAYDATKQRYGDISTRIAMNLQADSVAARQTVLDVFEGLNTSIPEKEPRLLLPFITRIIRSTSTERAVESQRTEVSNFRTILDELQEFHDTQKPAMGNGEILSGIAEYLQSLHIGRRQLFIRRYFYGDSVLFLAEQYRVDEKKIVAWLKKLRTDIKKIVSFGDMDRLDIFKVFLDFDDKLLVEAEKIDPTPDDKRYKIFRLGSILLALIVIVVFVIIFSTMDGDSQKANITAVPLKDSSPAFSAEIGGVFEKNSYSSISNLLPSLTKEQVISDAPSIRGTIKNIYNVEVYRIGTSCYQSAIAEITVDESIHGELSAGDTIKVLLSLPVYEEDGVFIMSVEDTDFISEMKIGQSGIFFLNKIGKEIENSDYLINGEQDRFYFADIADYRFLNSMQYIILENDGHLELNAAAFTEMGCKEITEMKTLDEAQSYIKGSETIK